MPSPTPSSAPPAYVIAALDAFAGNLKAARTRAGLTQSALAAAAGVRESYVSMLERGQRNPPLDTIALLAHALGTTVSALVRSTT